MTVKMSAQEAEEKIKKLNEHLSLKHKTYTNATAKCTWVDDRYGEFEKSTSVMLHNGNAYHPMEKKNKLSKSRTKPLSEYLKIINEINNNITLLNPEFYKNSQTIMTWKEEGFEKPFKRSIAQMIHGTADHPEKSFYKISSKKTLPIETVLKRLKDKNINLTIKNISEYKNVRTIMEWVTPAGLVFKRTVASVLSGRIKHPDEIKNNKKPLEYFLKKIQEINPKITVLNPQDFKNSQSVLEWYEEGVGVFKRSVIRMIHRTSHNPKTTKERIKRKFIEKYGTDNPMKSFEIYKKASTKARLVKTVEHWKTGEKLSCRGQYEYAVISYLNHYQINYKWQIAFTTPWSSIYNIDLYLLDEDKYIEIKGIWIKPEISKRKWEWFHKNYPNSEVWFKEELVAKGILKKNGSPIYYSRVIDRSVRKK